MGIRSHEFAIGNFEICRRADEILIDVSNEYGGEIVGLARYRDGPQRTDKTIFRQLSQR